MTQNINGRYWSPSERPKEGGGVSETVIEEAEDWFSRIVVFDPDGMWNHR